MATQTGMRSTPSFFSLLPGSTAAGLFVFLLASLLMTPESHSIDELAMFVTAVNVVDRGEFHANQLGHALWAIRPGEEVVSLGWNDNVYSKKSPLMAFLMVPAAAIGLLVRGLGAARAVLWLGPLLAALIAVTFDQIGKRLGYGRRVRMAAVLLLALGTMLLPYAQTVFGELLAALGMLLILYPFLPAQDRNGQDAALAGLGVGLAAGANPVYFALAPLLFLLLLNRQPKTSLRQTLAFGVLVLAVAVFLAGFNLARFGSIWETGYGFAPGQEGFTTPLWWGVLGLTVSPARGLLWYSPPVILGIAAWPRFHRHRAELSLTMIFLVLFHLVAFGLWWEWWGGYAWGPRFLLPTVPLLLLAALPGLELALTGPGRWRVAAAAVLAAGLLAQTAGVTINFNAYEQQLDATYPAPPNEPLRYHHDPSLVYDTAASPLVIHWREILNGAADWQLGWWRHPPPAAPAVLDSLAAQHRPGDVVILLDPALQGAFLERRGLPPVWGLPAGVFEADPLVQTLWRRALRDAQRVWLVTPLPPAAVEGWIERRLRESWAFTDEIWVDDRRFLLLARPPAAGGRIIETAARFGPILLRNAHLAGEADTLFIELNWTAYEAPAADYTFFVHLVDNDGRIVAQQDQPPLGGYRPTGGWLPGERIEERLALDLPPGQLDAVQEVRLGWYSWPDLVRLPAQAETLPVVDDSLIIPVTLRDR